MEVTIVLRGILQTFLKEFKPKDYLPSLNLDSERPFFKRLILNLKLHILSLKTNSYVYDKQIFVDCKGGVFILTQKLELFLNQLLLWISASSASINMSKYKQALKRNEISPGNCFRLTTKDKQSSSKAVCVPWLY